MSTESVEFFRKLLGYLESYEPKKLIHGRYMWAVDNEVLRCAMGVYNSRADYTGVSEDVHDEVVSANDRFPEESASTRYYRMVEWCRDRIAEPPEDVC